MAHSQRPLIELELRELGEVLGTLRHGHRLYREGREERSYLCYTTERNNMRGDLGWRVLTWGLITVLLLNGCAAVPRQGTGGSGKPEPRGPLPESEAWAGLEEARRAEINSALLQLWGVTSQVRDVGAVLEFTYWVESGAAGSNALEENRHASITSARIGPPLGSRTQAWHSRGDTACRARPEASPHLAGKQASGTPAV
jgi:hypothetical protein